MVQEQLYTSLIKNCKELMLIYTLKTYRNWMIERTKVNKNSAIDLLKVCRTKDKISSCMKYLARTYKIYIAFCDDNSVNVLNNENKKRLHLTLEEIEKL